MDSKEEQKWIGCLVHLLSIHVWHQNGSTMKAHHGTHKWYRTYIRAVRNDKSRIMSVTVNFKHKKQEEGNPIWTTKRLHQLNLLFDLLGDKELSP